MPGIILLSVLGFVLVMLIIMTYYLRSVAGQFEEEDEAVGALRIQAARALLNLALVRPHGGEPRMVVERRLLL